MTFEHASYVVAMTLMNKECRLLSSREERKDGIQRDEPRYSKNLGKVDSEVQGRTTIYEYRTFDITYRRNGIHTNLLVATDANNSITTKPLRPFNLDTTAWCCTECQRPEIQAQGIAYIAAQEEEQNHLHQP